MAVGTILITSSSGEEDSSGSDDVPSERLRKTPSDLFEKFGVHQAQLLSLGKEDSAKLVDALYSVGVLLLSGVRKLINVPFPAFRKLPSRFN